MGGAIGREWRRGPKSWLILSTSLIVLSSFFIIAGAQVASASQCGQANNPPACSLQFRFEDPAKSGIYTDTSPHQAAVGETITRVDLDPNGPPVIVEVEDANGHRDTNYGGQISLAIFSGSGTLSGATAMAVAGAASFTHLSIDTKGDFQLTATASPGTGIASSAPSGTFRIHADSCTAGQTCADSFLALMSASLTNGGTGTVALSVAIDGVDPIFGGTLTSCSTPSFTDPFFHAPAEWTVDEFRAMGTGTKLLIARFDKTWRQMVLDRGIQSYRPCITAQLTAEEAASVPTWDGSPMTETVPGQWTFLAPDCSRTITYFCRAYVKSNKSGDVIQGISLPSGTIFGDPRGH